jgi:hypothetical protein
MKTKNKFRQQSCLGDKVVLCFNRGNKGKGYIKRQLILFFVARTNRYLTSHFHIALG